MYVATMTTRNIITTTTTTIEEGKKNSSSPFIILFILDNGSFFLSSLLLRTYVQHTSIQSRSTIAKQPTNPWKRHRKGTESKMFCPILPLDWCCAMEECCCCSKKFSALLEWRLSDFGPSRSRCFSRGLKRCKCERVSNKLHGIKRRRKEKKCTIKI